MQYAPAAPPIQPMALSTICAWVALGIIVAMDLIMDVICHVFPEKRRT